MKDMKEVVARPRKVALYCSLTLNDYYPIQEVEYSRFDEQYNPLPEGQLRERIDKDCIRISEPIEIQFVGLESEQMATAATESLNQQERDLTEEFAKKLANVREKRSQLLALTHQVES